MQFPNDSGYPPAVNGIVYAPSVFPCAATGVGSEQVSSTRLQRRSTVVSRLPPTFTDVVPDVSRVTLLSSGDLVRLHGCRSGQHRPMTLSPE